MANMGISNALASAKCLNKNVLKFVTNKYLDLEDITSFNFGDSGQKFLLTVKNNFGCSSIICEKLQTF